MRRYWQFVNAKAYSTSRKLQHQVRMTAWRSCLGQLESADLETQMSVTQSMSKETRQTMRGARIRSSAH